MRTAAEIFKSIDKNLPVIDFEDIVIAINIARKEAIEECAERAESIEGWSTGLRKQSILLLINELS